MANPNNNGTYYGKVCRQPIFIHNQEGVDFQARFTLQVKRNYKNKGKYGYDFIPMRISGPESRLKIARRLKNNDVIIVSGSTTTEAYQKAGKIHYEFYISVDQISFPPRNFQHETEAAPVEKKSRLPFG